MKKKKFLRSAVLSAALSVILAVNVLPCSAFAEEAEAGTDTEITVQTADNNAAAETPAAGENAGTEERTGDNADRTGQGASQKTSTVSSVQTVEEYDYDITVTLTKQRGTLTDISVTSETSGKNDRYTSSALAGIAGQLKNGAEADVVSGATYSSEAILAALSEVGDYDSVSENLTASLNGTEASSSQSGQSGKGQGESGQEEAKTVPANYITYTVSTDSEGHKVVAFQLSPDAQKDNTYVNMVLIVDENGKHFMPVDAGSDESGNGNDYFSYQAENTSFTVLKDDLTSIEVIFTSDEYGKVHFTADLTAVSGGNEEGSGAKEDDPKENTDKDSEEPETEESGKVNPEESKAEETAGNTDKKTAETDTTAETQKAEEKAAEDKTDAQDGTAGEATAPASADTVKTGDSVSAPLFAALALLSAIGFAAVRRFRKN